MKKTLIILINLFLVQSLFSQQIKVDYSVVFEGNYMSDEAKKNNETLAKSMNGIENEINSQKFALYIEKNKSKFVAEHKMDADNKSFSAIQAEIFSGVGEVFFRDNEKKELINNCNILDKNFNVLEDFDKVQWQLSNDTKIINGFTCFKASWKYRNIDVFAWYCPALPYAFGPREFGGLHGLIVELQRGKLTFLATKIDTNYKISNELEIPKSKKITNKEAEEMSMKALEEMGN